MRDLVLRWRWRLLHVGCLRARVPPPGLELAMIYVLAALVPPLGLLLNGQPFSAVLNFVMLVVCILLAFFFPPLLLLPSIHALIVVHTKREDRKHRELVDAIERHGPPPGWRP